MCIRDRTFIVILSFAILNIFWGGGDELVRKMKIEEERIAQEKKLNEVISSLPSGIVVFYDGTDHYKLSKEQYEAVCKITKLIPQRAIMAAHFLNYKAYELYEAVCNATELIPQRAIMAAHFLNHEAYELYLSLIHI